jgi:hypothetical protein
MLLSIGTGVSNATRCCTLTTGGAAVGEAVGGAGVDGGGGVGGGRPLSIGWGVSTATTFRAPGSQSRLMAREGAAVAASARKTTAEKM